MGKKMGTAFTSMGSILQFIMKDIGKTIRKMVKEDYCLKMESTQGTGITIRNMGRGN